MRTDGLDVLSTVSGTRSEQGVRLHISTCMQTLIPMSSNYFKPVTVNIRDEQRKVELRRLNERLARLI